MFLVPTIDKNFAEFILNILIRKLRLDEFNEEMKLLYM